MFQLFLLLFLLFSPSYVLASHWELKWELSVSENVAGYNIYSCPNKPCVVATAKKEVIGLAPTTTSWIIPDIYKTRFFLVTSFDANGVEARSFISSVGLDQVAPLPPTNVRLSATATTGPGGGQGGGEGLPPPNDITAPVGAVTSPLAGAEITTDTSTLTGTCTDNVAPVGNQLKVNNGNVGVEDTVSPDSNSITYDWTQTGNGSHTVGVECRDAAKNKNNPVATQVTITLNRTVTPPPDPPPGGYPALPAAGFAAYPTSFMPTTPYFTGTEPTTQIAVAAGGDLQAAINNAPCDRTIVVNSGSTYRPSSGIAFVLPNKGCTATTPIVIRPSNLTGFAATGVRTNPASHSANYFKLMPVAGTDRSVLLAAFGASFYWIYGAEFLGNCTNLSCGNQDLVDIGQHPDCCVYPQTQANMPHDIVFDRSYFHADPLGDSKRGIGLNGNRLAVINNYFTDIHSIGGDGGVCIGGFVGGSTFEISNNHLECSGIPVIFGGASPWFDQAAMSDIYFHHNYITKKLSWFQGNPGYVWPHSATHSGYFWVSKNGWECKNCNRVLIDSNYWKNGWTTGGGQRSYAVLLSARNDQGNCTWCNVQNVTVQRNFVEEYAASFGVSAQGFMSVSPWSLNTGTANHTLFRNNILKNIDALKYGFAPHIGIIAQPGGRQHRFEHNTIIGTNTGVLWFEGGFQEDWRYTDNITHIGTTGFNGSGCGTGAQIFIQCSFGGSHARGNVIVGGNSSSDPPNNQYPSSFSAVGFTDFSTGNYKLSASSPFKNTAIDQSYYADPGADYDTVIAATTGLVD